jgi:tRNA (guanine37-N1)-methyltransferase
VGQFVRPFCEDGRSFIHNAADAVLAASRAGEHALITQKDKGSRDKTRKPPRQSQIKIPVPPTIAHFVMNLPASAIEFLGSYRGLYAGHESLFQPSSTTAAAPKLPLVHVHCFSVKADDETPLLDICERITRELGFPMRPGDDVDVEGQVAIHNVRAVAPAKTMYCASFRLPREVAFAPRP